MPRSLFAVRTSRALRLAPLLVALALLGPVAALALDPPRLTGGLTDRTGVLDDSRDAIGAAQARLSEATGTSLYVLFVPSTEDQDIDDFADAVIERNGGLLTDTDALLVVATEDRRYSIVLGRGLSGKVSQAELDALRRDGLEPRLRADEWGAAVTAAAVGLQEVISGASPGEAPRSAEPGGAPGGEEPGGEEPAGTGGGGLGLVGLILVVAVLAVGGIVLWQVLRARSEYRERAVQEDLGRQASRLLLEIDDALRAADQEAGFAEAEFGAAGAAGLVKALEGARAELNAAFSISQALDDDSPETPEQRRQMLEEIVARCQKAGSGVAEQQARIDELRDLARNVDAVLPRALADLEALEQRQSGAEAMLATLLERYGGVSVEAYRDDPAVAAQGLVAARVALERARTALAEGHRGDAVVAVREGQVALAEAAGLLDALAAAGPALDEVARKVTAAVEHVRSDVATARAQVQAGHGAERAAEVERAAAAMGEAETALAAQPPDVVSAARLAASANEAVDAAIAGIAEAESQRQRLMASVEATIGTAEASIAAAGTAISAGRSGGDADRRARTRLAEATTHLARAREMREADPDAALQAARTADTLADEALREAQVSATAAGLPPLPVPGAPPGAPPGWGRHDPGMDLGSFILGSILGGIFSGGGPVSRDPFPRSGRRPGGSDRGGGGWGGRGGGFGGFGSGGFGGGSSGGGRPSGGGGGGGMRAGRRGSGGF